MKSATNYDVEDCKDVGEFVVAYNAPTSGRDQRPRGTVASDSEGTGGSDWSAQMRSILGSKLSGSGSKDEESLAERLDVLTPTKKQKATETTSGESALADLTRSGARMTRNVILNSGKQLPTPPAGPGRFVPISTGVTTKADRLSAGLPTVTARTTARGPASGAQNSGGSQSARTTPQRPSSPTKDVRQTRVRSKSNARDDYETTTTAATAGARTARAGANDVMRRNGVGADTTRRHRNRSDVMADSAASAIRQPGGRSTNTRQDAPPAASKLRSTSQKRPGEMSAVTRPQPSRTTADTTRSQYRSASSVLFKPVVMIIIKIRNRL